MLSSKGVKTTSMISTFENCKNLKDFLFSGFDTSSVKSMKNLFYGANLGEINIAGINTENVLDFSYMFASVEEETIEIQKFNTKSAKNMSHMFDYSRVRNLDYHL